MISLSRIGTEEKMKPGEGVRGRQKRTRPGLERAPECFGKQKRYQYMIAPLRFYAIRQNEVEEPVGFFRWEDNKQTQ
jgi:hypothetical protein